MSLVRSPHLLSTPLVALTAFTLLSGCGPAPEPGAWNGDASALNGTQTVILQNGVSPTAGYSGTTDVMLQESAPTANKGALPFVQLDRDYEGGTHQSVDGLLRFQLTGIPAGSTVQAVQLTLNVTNGTSGEGYAVYPAGKSWSQNEATWNQAASGHAWSLGGARGSADRGGTAFATLTPTGAGQYTVSLNAAGIQAVQGWLDGSSENDGFVLDAQTNTDGLVFDSSEATTASHRPKLTVTYALPGPQPGNGTGLLGQYYSGVHFDSLALTRTDPTVAFNWGTGAPASSLPVDGFSVRWTGQVQPLYSETYQFFTTSDDGIRLWVNGQQIIDHWTDHAATEKAGSITLTAGHKYDLKLEYYERAGNAVAKLSWSSPSQAKEVIPSAQLYVPSTGEDAGTPDAGTPDAGTPDAGTDGGVTPVDPVATALDGLDPTGATIPDSNYPIPTGAIFMSTTGSDTAAGTQAAPVKTLNRAVALLPSAGGTIVVRGGTDAAPALYRDWYFYDNATVGKTFGVLNKVVTLQAYPHEKAWFDGTDVIPTQSWKSDGAGHWYLDWSTPSFCGTLPTATTSNYYKVSLDAQRTTADGPCGWHDSSLDPTNPMALDPQMVFIDGVYIHEVASLAEATGSNFYYDWSNKRLYLATNPSGHTVELAARPMAFQLQKAGSKVLGLGFKRYATHVYSNNPGAIYSGPGQTFENDVFKEMAGHALTMHSPQGSVVNRCVFVNNGGDGIGGNGSRSAGVRDDTVIQKSIFRNNNTELFWTNCSYSCGAAAIKLNNMVGFTIQENLIENTQGRGIGAWCDIACVEGKYLYNVVHDNGGPGILHEISDTGTIASNLVYRNGGAGIRVCAAHTKIYNNTVIQNGTAGSYIQGDVWIYDDPRSPSNPDTGNTGATAVGPDTVAVEYANNILSSDNRMTAVQGTRTDSTNTVPSQFFDLYDYNAYHRVAGANQSLVHWVEPAGTTDYKSSNAFTAAHAPLDAHSVDITSSADPFFVDAAHDDYRLRASQQAGTGINLPADVVNALGLTSGNNLPKGAITWPGKR